MLHFDIMERVVRKRIYSLSIAGVMSALVILLAMTPLGYIKIIPTVAFTAIHIPVIFAGILGGPFAGIITGMMFGLTSLINAAGNASLLSPFTLNPLVSVFPRMLVGLFAATTFRGMCYIKIPRLLATGISAFFSSWTNTIGYFGMIFLIYSKDASQIFEGKAFFAVLALYVVPCLLEACSALVICVMAFLAIDISTIGKKAKIFSEIKDGDIDLL